MVNTTGGEAASQTGASSLTPYKSIFKGLEEQREGSFYVDLKNLEDSERPFRPLDESTVQEIEFDIKKRGFLSTSPHIIVTIICPSEYQLKVISKEEREKRNPQDINGSELRTDDLVLAEQSQGIRLEVADGRHRFTALTRLVKKKWFESLKSLLIPVDVYRNLSKLQTARLTMCKRQHLCLRYKSSSLPKSKFHFLLTLFDSHAFLFWEQIFPFLHLYHLRWEMTFVYCR